MRECNMEWNLTAEIAFTKASKKDGTLVTVSLTALDTAGVVIEQKKPIMFQELDKTDEFILHIDGVPTVWSVNREKKTAASRGFPRHLRLPRVGSPTYVTIETFSRLLGEINE